MANCMECDEDIDEDCDVCPGCGLDAPVSYRWYRDLYREKVEEAKKNNDSKLLCELYFEAYVDAGMFPDPYVVGDMARELEVLYLELNYHEQLIWLYVFDATSYDLSFLEEPGRKAYLHSVEIKREDLELYVMEELDSVRWTRFRGNAPEDLATRKSELLSKVTSGDLERIVYGMINENMWIDFTTGNKSN
jgi:hypothetical protein